MEERRRMEERGEGWRRDKKRDNVLGFLVKAETRAVNLVHK